MRRDRNITLYLGNNPIRDAGVAALAAAAAQEGALASVRALSFGGAWGGNNIGDAGFAALAEALGGGALGKLKSLWVSDGPCGTDRRLEEVCRSRGVELRGAR